MEKEANNETSLNKPPRCDHPLLLALGVGCLAGSIVSILLATSKNVSLDHWVFESIVAAAVLALLAYPLCSYGVGRRRLVVYLRHFGNEDLNTAVLKSFRQALGRRYRVVALDDSNFVPVGIPILQMVKSVVVALILGILIAYGSFIAMPLFTNPNHSIYSDDVNIVRYIFGPTVIILTPLVIGIIGALFYVIAFVYQRHERLSKVTTSKELQSIVDSVKKEKDILRSLSIFAPLARVILVSDELWKDAVTALARVADIVIIDVSTPSDSIAWELQRLATLRTRILVLRSETNDDSGAAVDEWNIDVADFFRRCSYQSYRSAKTLNWQTLLRGISDTEHFH